MRLTTWETRNSDELRRQLAELERRFGKLELARFVGIQLQDEGALLSKLVTGLNFVGATVIASFSSTTGVGTITISADPAGTAAAAMAAHLAAGDPHPQYLTAAEGNAVYQPLDGDLTSLAAAAGTNTIYYRSAVNTWSPVSVSSPLTFSGGFLAVSTGFADNTFRINDNGDATKQLAWEVSGVTTATVRTTEAANADIDLTCSDAVMSEDFLTAVSSATASTSGVAIGDVTFLNALIGTWTHVIASLDTNHPGILRLGLPATAGAASGIIWAPHQSGGGDLFAFTFRTPAAFTSLTIKLGQFAGNTAVTTEPTDGVYLWQTAGTSTFGFKSANASTRTAGATGALSASTWYTAFIRWNTGRTQADCFLLNDAGTVVLSANLSTNLPTTAAVLYGQAFVSTSASAVAAALDLDKVAMRLGSRGRKLTRPTPNAVQEFMRL